MCTDGESNKGVGTFWNTEENVKEFYIKMGNIAKEKGIVISLIAFEDCESKIDILKNMVYNSGGDIFRVNPNLILDEVNDFLENKALASQVEIKINLNKCMTFRDEEKNDIINDGSTILKNIGNVTKEKETYFELKFKHAEQLAEIKEINYDDFTFLIFQIEIIYRKNNRAKYIRVISKKLKLSDNKEIINKQANLNIVSTLQIQKSAKLAGAGKLKDAQVQIHIARNYLKNNINYLNNYQIYQQFNHNMNSFHKNLNNMNMMELNNDNDVDMTFGDLGEINNNNMDMNITNRMDKKNNMNFTNMTITNRMDRKNDMDISITNIKKTVRRNSRNNMDITKTFRRNRNNNIDMTITNMNKSNIDMNISNIKNSDDMKSTNKAMSITSDLISGQIYSLSNTSEKRQTMTYNRYSKKNNNQ